MTEEQLREAQQRYLEAESALERAKAWTPTTIDVARLVIERINDRYASTKPNVEEEVELVFQVLKSVQRRLVQPSLWAPAAAPGPEFIPQIPKLN